MTEKTRIPDSLVERTLLLPSLVNLALAANDRIKYRFALLKTAQSNAEQPAARISSLRTERLAAGVLGSVLDQAVGGTQKLDSDLYRMLGTPERSIAARAARQLRRLFSIALEAMAIQRSASDAFPIGWATPAGVGVASRPAVFSPEAAQRPGKRDMTPIPVSTEIAIRDVGALTSTGGHTVHAAGVARQMGTVCLVGCNESVVDEVAGSADLGQTTISEGDRICLNANTGAIYSGSHEIIGSRPQELIDRISGWGSSAEAGRARSDSAHHEIRAQEDC